MKTHAERLPVEIWLTILSYIEVHDLFYAFLSLNAYFNKLLNSSHLLLHVQFQSTKEKNNSKSYRSNFNWSNSILNRITCLQSNSEYSSSDLPQFLQYHSKELIRLKSLISRPLKPEYSSICNAIEKIDSLQYVSLTCIPNQKLLEAILLAPNLRICRLKFHRPTSFIDYNFWANSNVEILRIKILEQSSHAILYLLLSHMPKLKHLEIDQCNPLPLINQNIFILEHLHTLKLFWNSSEHRSNYFEQCHRVTPCLRRFYLVVNYFQFDELSDKNLIHFLLTLLKRIKPITIGIQCCRLTTTVDDNIVTKLNDYCQQLLFELNTQNNGTFQIRWTEEKLNEHKIQVISQ